MHFQPSEEATALREAVVGATGAVTPAVVRAGWPGGDSAAVLKVWRALGAGGVFGVLVAEEHGGLGLDEEAAVLALETLGYCGLPLPVVETLVVAAPLLAAGGSSLLEAVLDGSAVITAVPFVSGTDLLPYGQICDAAIVTDGVSSRLYAATELDLEPVESVDGARQLARVTSKPDGVVLSDDVALIERSQQRGALGTAAVLIGLSQRLLDMTVDYVKQREQFGVPIGSFQAIKHALASALLAQSFARPAVLAASWSLAHDEPVAAQRVSMAKVMAAEAALQVTRTAIQCHGAIAYTTEYDLHLFAKRVWALAPAWGTVQWHRAHLSAQLGLSTGTER
jgi:alkylation response protein AidB-like acyl-CoA dehydrogenase